MTKTTYGILSDMHAADPLLIRQCIERLQKEGAQKLILNGDLVGDQYCRTPNALTPTPDVYFGVVLEAAAKTGLETFVQPGSHEEIADFIPMLEELSCHFPNIMNVLEHPAHQVNGHHLVFLPGSDFRAGGQFALLADSIPEGTYVQTGQGLASLTNEQWYGAIKHPQARHALLQVTNMNNVEKLVTDSERTIVVCHVPRKFNTLEYGVDHAYFAERLDGSGLLPGIVVETTIRRQAGNVSSEQLQAIARQNGFIFKRENRGNEALTALYERLDITKAPTGHFHESAHRATDASGKPLREGELTTELFWNASYVDQGLVGLLTVDGTQVSYRNINLRKP